MNAAYAPYAISFTNAGTDWTVNSNYAADGSELAMKKALRKGTYADLNLYFVNSMDYLGYWYVPLLNPWLRDFPNEKHVLKSHSVTSQPLLPPDQMISTMMVAPFSLPPSQVDLRPTTTRVKLSPTRLDIGSVFTTLSRVDVPELVTRLPILQLRLPLLRAALLDVIPAHPLVSIQSTTTWTTLMSMLLPLSLLLLLFIRLCVLMRNSSCYEEFTAGQSTRMNSYYSTYRAGN